MPDEIKCQLKPLPKYLSSPINTFNKLSDSINSEYFCKTPPNLNKFLAKQYSLKKATLFQKSSPNITTAVKVKIIKHRLEVDATKKEIILQCYVHFLNALRNIDTWVNFEDLTDDVKNIEFLTKEHGFLHNKQHRESNKNGARGKANFNFAHSSANNFFSPDLNGQNQHILDYAGGSSSHNGNSFSYHSNRTFLRNSKVDKLEQDYQKMTDTKFINNVYYDGLILKPQYWSPLPTICDNQHDMLYVCYNSLNFFENYKNYESLRSKHFKLPKFSKKIYEVELENTSSSSTDKLEVLEMNPTKSKELHLYCQRLALFSKLFIDHKTLFFDNEESFIFYVLFINDKFVGYFSKESGEEENADYNHLSCFVILPQYQKRGYGLFLASLADVIAQSLNEMKLNELKKNQDSGEVNLAGRILNLTGLVSGPEFPLSPSGRKTYFKYWKGKIAESIEAIIDQQRSPFSQSKNLNAIDCSSKTVSTSSAGRKRSHNQHSTLSSQLSDNTPVYKDDQSTSIVLNISDLSQITKIRKKDLEFFLLNSNDFPKGIEFSENSENGPEYQILINFENKNVVTPITINKPNVNVTPPQPIGSKSKTQIKVEDKDVDIELIDDLLVEIPDKKCRKYQPLLAKKELLNMTLSY